MRRPRALVARLHGATPPLCSTGLPSWRDGLLSQAMLFELNALHPMPPLRSAVCPGPEVTGWACGWQVPRENWIPQQSQQNAANPSSTQQPAGGEARSIRPTLFLLNLYTIFDLPSNITDFCFPQAPQVDDASGLPAAAVVKKRLLRPKLTVPSPPAHSAVSLLLARLLEMFPSKLPHRLYLT